MEKYLIRGKWNNIDGLCVMAIFLFIYGRGYGETVAEKYSTYCAAITIPLLLLSFIQTRKVCRGKFDSTSIKFAVISIVLLAVSAPFWYSFYNAYSYIGVCIAYLVYLLDCNKFRNLIIYALAVCTLLEFFEYITEQYFYITSLNDMELDEKLFSGGGAFRAKGLFKGPLSVGPFAVLTYLLNYKKRWVLLLAMIACFFANSRTGIVILTILLGIQLFGGHVKIKYVIMVLVIGSFLFALLLSNSIISSSVDRILDVSNSESSTNQARLFFWIAGINTYLNYPLSNLIFGNNGFFHSIYDNNPESGWICLLTDNGLVGFLYYMLPLMYCLIHFYVKKRRLELLTTFVFIVMNFVITANLSATSNLLYWIFMFEMYNKAKYGVCKYDLISK